MAPNPSESFWIFSFWARVKPFSIISLGSSCSFSFIVRRSFKLLMLFIIKGFYLIVLQRYGVILILPKTFGCELPFFCMFPNHTCLVFFHIHRLIGKNCCGFQERHSLPNLPTSPYTTVFLFVFS